MKHSSHTRRKKPKIKIVCSFNGSFTCRRQSDKLRYVGDETSIISVDRTITFSRLKSKIFELIKCPKQDFYLNYEIYNSDKGEKKSSLALIDSDDDVRCMIDVYEKLEFRGKCYRLWIYVCNHDEYFNLQKLHNVVFNKVDACDKMKYSDDCLRKVVLKQQLVAKQSEFFRSYCRDLRLGSEQGEVERDRFDDKNCGDYGVSLSCDSVSPRFVGSSCRSDTDKVECGCNDDCMESRNYIDLVDSRILNVKDTGDYKCNHDNCMESRSYVDLVSLLALHSRTLNSKDMVDHLYDDVNSVGSRSYADLVPLSVSHSLPMDQKDMVDYKCDDDNFMESRSYSDSVLLTASHSRPSILKDEILGVGINESDPTFINAGRLGSFNSIGNLHFPRPYSIMSYYDVKCDSKSVEPATLSNLNRENILPCSVGSMTLRPELAPLSFSNQLLGGLSKATSTYVSSDSSISNHHFSPGDARKQRIYHPHSRSNPCNFIEIGNHRKVRLDGRPWLGKFYPGIQSSSGTSKQGKVVKSSYPTLLKPLSDSSSQQVKGNASASQCILNNITCSFAFPSGTEGNISEHDSAVPQKRNTNPQCHFSNHDPLPSIADQYFFSLVVAEKLPGCTEGLNTKTDFISNCVPKQHSTINQQDVANISRSPNKTELGCSAKLLKMGAVWESFSKNQSGVLITQKTVNFSSHNLSLLSLDDLKSPTHSTSIYISDTSVKPQKMGLHLMDQEHFGTGPKAQISNEAVSISDKAMECCEENKQEAVLQQNVGSALSIEDKDEIKKKCDESKANGELPPEIATIYNHLAIGKLQVIKNADLEYIKELGSGTYGTVFYGKWKGSDVAIKKLKAGCFDGGVVEENRLIAYFWKEAHILGQLRHPNIVALYGVVADGPATNLATVTEFMINGSLKQVFRRKDRTIDRRKRLILAMDTAFGMEYLHDKNIVHFDLKSHNLLVNMRDPWRPVCKIGDLGLSKIKQKTLVSGGVRGTIPWMAPELLSCKSLVTEKVDVYSFGIVMWELLTGEEPYLNMRSYEIIAGIIKGTLRPETPAWCDPAWKLLMEKCWSTDPANRPAFSEIAKELRTMAAAMNIKLL